jgi:hypothetical protein
MTTNILFLIFHSCAALPQLNFHNCILNPFHPILNSLAIIKIIERKKTVLILATLIYSVICSLLHPDRASESLDYEGLLEEVPLEGWCSSLTSAARFLLLFRFSLYSTRRCLALSGEQTGRPPLFLLRPALAWGRCRAACSPGASSTSPAPAAAARSYARPSRPCS